MSTLRLSSFQSAQAWLNTEPLTHFPRVKAQALLIYLAVEQDRPHRRDALAGLLWPDSPEARARRNLSQTLMELRRTLGDDQNNPPFILASAQTIAFNPASDCWTDVATFESALANAAYAEAVDLYRGPFLADFEVADSDLFTDWVQAQRENLHRRALEAFHKLSLAYEQQEKLEEARQVVDRLLVLAPWQEEAHCRLMRLLARGGQRSAALAQYDTLTQMLMDELGVAPAPETDALYDQILAGEIGALGSAVESGVPTLLSTSSSALATKAPFQALPPPAHFVGRQAEIDALRVRLRAPDLQIHALVGMGGVGKTTLATQIAHAARAEFPDGVLWGNPATSAPLDILASWAGAYGYDFSGLADLASRAAAMRGMLADKRALIVIDNVVTLRGVEPLLPNSDGCAVLLTTRDLDVATALNAATTLLGELDEGAALDLLRGIVGEERVAAEIEAAVELCVLCGELPLAVEITAQRLKSRPRLKLAQMAVRLGDQEQRLGLEISDRAVRASFAVSWDGLDAALQRTFALQAVFAGRAFRADAIAHLADEDLFKIEDQLYTLAALSLLHDAGDAYFRQHPLLADFAREKLDASGQTTSVTARYADYFYDFAAQNTTNFAKLDSEWENLMDAMRSAHAHERWQLVVDYAQALTRPWQTRARYGDARKGFAWAYDAATMLADEEAVAINLLRWGEACLEQNDYDEAETRLTDSLEHYMHLEDDMGVSEAYYDLAIVWLEKGNYQQADNSLANSLAVRRLIHDQSGVSKIILEQARIRFELDELDAAEELGKEALSLHSELNEPVSLSAIYRHLAMIEVERGAYEKALAYAEDARKLGEQHPDDGERMATLYVIAGIKRDQHCFDGAKVSAEAGLEIAQHRGFLRYEGMFHLLLCRIVKHLGQHKMALRHAQQGEQIFSKIQDQRNLTFAYLLLSELHEEAGQREDAWIAAQKVAEQTGNRDLRKYAENYRKAMA